MKICSKCSIEKPFEFFAKDNRKKDGHRSQCKQCYNLNWKYRIMSNLTAREHSTLRAGQLLGYSNIKHKSKLINGDFLEELKLKQNGLCYWLEIPIDFSLKDKLRKPSLDRLDNKKGYEIDNVVLTTLFANLGRRDSTVYEFNLFLKQYIKK